MKKNLTIILNITLTFLFILNILLCPYFSEIPETCNYWPFTLIILVPFILVPLNIISFFWIENLEKTFKSKNINSKYLQIVIYLLLNIVIGISVYVLMMVVLYFVSVS